MVTAAEEARLKFATLLVEEAKEISDLMGISEALSAIMDDWFATLSTRLDHLKMYSYGSLPVDDIDYWANAEALEAAISRATLSTARAAAVLQRIGVVATALDQFVDELEACCASSDMIENIRYLVSDVVDVKRILLRVFPELDTS